MKTKHLLEVKNRNLKGNLLDSGGTKFQSIRGGYWNHEPHWHHAGKVQYNHYGLRKDFQPVDG
ncbi:hypothetical protein KGY79_13950 [Candidatus Bipolaricaulota bacterium]|nr:hypothetical protein [Candidatus Bipolaricaulota bacterium]